MSDLLYIGASGTRTYQTALSTTSENIANAATPGYTRRAATIAEAGRSNAARLGQRTSLVGSGSAVTGIARASDGFRLAEVRASGADVARTEGGVVWLERTEAALTGNELAGRLTEVFNAGRAVAADPAAAAPRAVMMESMRSLASAFAGTGRALDAAAADLATQGIDAARSLTDLAAQLKQVNVQLTRGDARSVGRAGLLDERDRLLEGMSALVDVDVSIDAFDRATVRVGGAAGPVLTDTESAGQVAFAVNSSGGVGIAVHRGGTTASVPAQGGLLAGLADGAARLAGTRAALNDLATRFVDGVNAVQGSGVDLDGNAGVPLLTAGASPTEIALATDDPRAIAAATPGEGVRGNGAIAGLATLRGAEDFEGDLGDLTAGNAAALAARRSVATAQGSIRDAAVAARDGVSGVDLDEEAVNLIRFQQAYQASSRVIQVARDILQSILEIR